MSSTRKKKCFTHHLVCSYLFFGIFRFFLYNLYGGGDIIIRNKREKKLLFRKVLIMCGFFNAPFCHLVSKKKIFFLRKKNQIGEGGIKGGYTSNIISRHFFSNVFDSTALFIIFSFFSSLIFFMFHQKRNKN